MLRSFQRNLQRLQRARRVRAKLSGTSERPRLSVFRSLRHLLVQLIDDQTGQTVVGLSDCGLTGTPTERAHALGIQIAQLAQAKKIRQIVFDRAGNKYHGRIAALAEALRTNGLEF